tara:strand:- start:731 stop:1780 length:1050 start_codon:yes stop_codon:yes gene_type:complete
MTTDGNIGVTITHDSQHALDAARAYKEQIANQLGFLRKGRPSSPAEQKLRSIDTKLLEAALGKASLPQNYSASLPAGVPSGTGGISTDSFLKKTGPDYSGWHRTSPVNMSDALDNDAWVRGAYQSLLGRDADDEGLTYWKGDLAGGASRDDVVANMKRSPEYRDKFIGEAYKNLLGRDVGLEGIDYWGRAMQDGASEDSVIANIKRSDEYGRRQQTAMRDAITPQDPTQLLNQAYDEQIATLGRQRQDAQDVVQSQYNTAQDYSPLLTTDSTIYTQDPEASKLASLNYLASQDPSEGSPSIWTQALRDAGANAIASIDIPGIVSGFFDSRKNRGSGQMLDAYAKSLPVL